MAEQAPARGHGGRVRLNEPMTSRTAGRLLATVYLHVFILASGLLASGWQHRACADETAGSSQRVFIDELQRRQLHRLASIHCEQLLADSALDADQQTDVVLELLESLAAEAQRTSDRGDVRAWQEALSAGETWLERTTLLLDRRRVALQIELVRMAQADWLQTTSALDPDPELRRKQAGVLLQQAARQLEILERDLGEQLRQPPHSNDAALVRAGNQLRKLMLYKKAEAQLQQARAVPAESLDRVALLNAALVPFDSLARLIPATELSLRSRLGEIESLLLMQQPERAEERLRKFPLDEASVDLRREHLLLTAKWLIATNETPKAIELLSSALAESPETLSQRAVIETRLARLEAYLVMARNGSSDEPASGAASWQTRAMQELAAIERLHDSYAVRRAEALLAPIRGPSTAADTSPPADLELLARTAANFYRRQQFDDAHLAFQRAAELAGSIKEEKRAAEYAFQAAAIRHQQQQTQVAAEEFARLAKQYPETSQAPEAHWLAILNTAQLARSDSTAADRYRELLQDHLQRWPAHPTTNAARYWAGKLAAQTGDWDTAKNQWRGVAADSEVAFESLQALRFAYLTALARIPAGVAKRTDLVTEAVTHFHHTASNAAAGEDEQRHMIVTLCRLTVAELRLCLTDAAPGQILETLTETTQEENYQRLSVHRWRALLGLAAACQGDTNMAQQHWQEVAWEELDFPVLVIERLDRSRQENRLAQHANVLARLQATYSHRLRQTPVWRDDPKLASFESSAWVALGERERAVEIYQQLVARDSQNADHHVALAEIYEQGPDDQVDRAIESWRRVVRFSAPRSDAWWRGKLGIARGLVRAGDSDRALKMLQTLQTLYPDLGGARWADAFRRELRSLGGIAPQRPTK